jgi:hypothetical protein
MVWLGSIFIAAGKYTGITDHVLAVNLIGVVFSSIAILFFYLLVQRICDTLTALLASFILLINPIFMDVSTYGINHAPCLCFLFLGLLSLLRFQSAGHISNLLLSTLYFGFMGATRLPDFILTFPALSYMFIAGLNSNSPWDNNNKMRYFLLFIFMTILIITLFHLPYITFDHTGYAIQAKDNWKLNLSNSFQGLWAWPFKNSLSSLLKTFTMVGLVCFSAGLYYASVLNKRLLIFTVLWWALPLIIFSNIITTAPRYLTIILPAFIIPISIFLAHMFRHKRILWRLIAPISCLIVLIQPLMNTRGTFIRRHHHSLIADFYRWVGKSTPSDATIISADDAVFITYYSGRKTLSKPVAVIGHISPEKLIIFKKNLDNILNARKPVYAAHWGLDSYDSFKEFRDLMRQNYDLIPIGQRPLESWYQTPFTTYLRMADLVKIEKKN